MPTVLVSNVRGPRSLEVADGEVVFVAARGVGDAIRTIPVTAQDGIGAEIHAESVSTNAIRSIAVDNGLAFAFVNRANQTSDVVIEIRIAESSSTDVEVRPVTGPLNAPMVGARGGLLVWSRRNNADNIGVRVDGGAITGADANTGPVCLQLSATALVWADGFSPFEVHAQASTFADAASTIVSLDGLCVAADATTDAVVVASGSKIVLVPDGAGASVVTTDPHPTDAAGVIVAVAVDSAFVYWVTDDGIGANHVLVRAPRTGAPTPVVLRRIEKPCGLAVDDTHVYWSECPGVVTNNRILRITKPS